MVFSWREKLLDSTRSVDSDVTAFNLSAWKQTAVSTTRMQDTDTQIAPHLSQMMSACHAVLNCVLRLNFAFLVVFAWRRLHTERHLHGRSAHQPE